MEQRHKLPCLNKMLSAHGQRNATEMAPAITVFWVQSSDVPFFCHFNISLIGCCWQPSKLQTVFSAHIVQCDIKWCILHWWVGEKWNKEGRAWLFLRIVEEKVRPCEGRWGEPGYQEAMRVKGGQKGQVEVKVYQPYTVTSNWEMLGGPGSHFDMLNG